MRLQGGNKETKQNVWEEYEFYILNGDIENLSHLVELKILDIDVKEIPTIFVLCSNWQ